MNSAPPIVAVWLRLAEAQRWDQYEFLWQMILSRGVVPLFQ